MQVISEAYVRLDSTGKQSINRCIVNMHWKDVEFWGKEIPHSGQNRAGGGGTLFCPSGKGRNFNFVCEMTLRPGCPPSPISIWLQDSLLTQYQGRYIYEWVFFSFWGRGTTLVCQNTRRGDQELWRDIVSPRTWPHHAIWSKVWEEVPAPRLMSLLVAMSWQQWHEAVQKKKERNPLLFPSLGFHITEWSRSFSEIVPIYLDSGSFHLC